MYAKKSSMDKLNVQLAPADVRVFQSQICLFASSDKNKRLGEFKLFSGARQRRVENDTDGPPAAGSPKKLGTRSAVHCRMAGKNLRLAEILFDGNALGEVAWFVHIATTAHGDFVGQQLQRNGRDNRL